MSETKVEVRRIRRVLRETVRLARDASMTGSLEDGRRSSLTQFNSSVRYLESVGALPGGLFQPLADEASFDEVGVAAAQLAGYLEEEGEETTASVTPAGSNVIVVSGLKAFKELKEFGQHFRDHLPEWFEERMGKREDDPEKIAAHLTEIENRLAEVGGKLQTVAEQLRRGDLSDQQRAELAEELASLGREQAKLAREHATLRERAGTSSNSQS